MGFAFMGFAFMGFANDRLCGDRWNPLTGINHRQLVIFGIFDHIFQKFLHAQPILHQYIGVG